MLPYLLILVRSGVGLFEGIFIKRYNAKHGKGGFLFTAIVALFSMAFFVFKDLVLTDGAITITPELLPYALLSAAFYASASFLTFIALSCGSFTLSILILSYSGIFTISYGIFVLGERLSVCAYIGLALVLVSLFLTRDKATKTEKEKKLSLKWLITIGISFVGNGMIGILMRAQQIKFNATLDNEFMIVTLAVSALILLIIGLAKDSRDLGYLLKHGGLYALLGGVANGATNALSLIINTMIAVSLSSSLGAGTKIVLSFLVSLVLFHEKFSKRQIVGVSLGMVSLVLLNL